MSDSLMHFWHFHLVASMLISRVGINTASGSFHIEDENEMPKTFPSRFAACTNGHLESQCIMLSSRPLAFSVKGLLREAYLEVLRTVWRSAFYVTGS